MLQNSNSRLFKTVFFILLFIILFSCNSVQTRIDNVDSISSKHQFTKKIIPTEQFNIVSYQKVSPDSDYAAIYIEGDGLAWLNRYRVSPNPTPANPVALKLAVLDNSRSVIYLGRPCHYVVIENEKACDPSYWTNKRASPEVISAINTAINKIKDQSNIKNIRLVGYSGGATIAAVLAANREDIIDLRTIAGNLDINTFSEIHNISALTGSLNPVDFADKLVKIPQINFISKNDDIITHEIINSYLEKLKKYDNNLKCIKIITLNGPTHSNGWENVWSKQSGYSHKCN
jgi:hypothetical protein